LRAEGKFHFLTHDHLPGTSSQKPIVEQSATPVALSESASSTSLRKPVDYELIEKVLEEAQRRRGDLLSKYTLSSDEALIAAEKWLGPGYHQKGKNRSGVFRSADGQKQFRIDDNSLLGKHEPYVPHVHFEKLKPDGGSPSTNNYVPFKD
jgi:hypothetical protein